MTEADDKSSLFDLESLKQKGGLNAQNILAVDPQLMQKFDGYLSITIKHDETTRKLILLTGLSAYTNEPINTFLRGDSSIGKTYVTIQTLRFFPKDDVWLLGGLSPTALVHDRGILIDKNGEEILLTDKPRRPGKNATQEEKEEYNDYRDKMKDARYLVDLRGKILVFLEAPNIETFNKLRPILSHDCFEITYKFTDKELAARTVILRGWPAAVFCSTDERFIQDLATRSFTFTPEISEVKIKDSNKLTGSKAAAPWKFQDNEDFMLLQSYIHSFKNMMQETQGSVPFGEAFGEQFPSKLPRSMRDFKHLLGLIQVRALFHYAQRPMLLKAGEIYVLATKEDYDSIIALWNIVKETTETSSAKHILTFFHEVVEEKAREKLEDEKKEHPDTKDTIFDFTLTVKDLTDVWNSKFSDHKSSDSIRNWVDFLCQVGYMTKEPNPNDKRENLLSIIKSEKNGNYTQNCLSAFFSLQSFKAWVKEANSIKEKDKGFLRENVLSIEEASPEGIYEKYYLNNPSENSFIDLTSYLASLHERTEKKADNQEIGHNRNLEEFHA